MKYVKSKKETQKLIMSGTSQGCDVEAVMKAMKGETTLSDATLRRALGIPAGDMDKELAERMKKIVADEKLCERFANTFFEQINTDEEPPEKMGHYMTKAILSDSVEDFMIAVCGWSPATLAKMTFEEELS